MNYYYSIDGTEVAGPYSLDDIRNDFFSGSLPPTTQVCAEGTETWQTLTSLVKPPPKQAAQPSAIPQQAHRAQTTIPTKSTAPSPTDLPAIPVSSLGAYVASTLQPNESPLHKTTIHWIIFLRAGIAALVFSIILVPISAAFASTAEMSPIPVGLAVFVLLIALLVIPPLITYLTSELVISDRRVLIKVGFISRRSIEMFISKIESVDVNQGIFGRLFDYGTVTLRGTGGSAEPFRLIAHPIQFRNCIQRIQSHNEGR